VEPELKDLNFENFQKFYNKLIFTRKVYNYTHNGGNQMTVLHW